MKPAQIQKVRHHRTFPVCNLTVRHHRTFLVSNIRANHMISVMDSESMAQKHRVVWAERVSRKLEANR